MTRTRRVLRTITAPILSSLARSVVACRRANSVPALLAAMQWIVGGIEVEYQLFGRRLERRNQFQLLLSSLAYILIERLRTTPPDEISGLA